MFFDYRRQDELKTSLAKGVRQLATLNFSNVIDRDILLVEKEIVAKK